MITPGQLVTVTYNAKVGAEPQSVANPIAQVYLGDQLTVVPTTVTTPEMGVYFVSFTAASGWTHGQVVTVVLSGTISGALVKKSKRAGQVDTLTPQIARDAKAAKNYSAAVL